MHIFDYSSLLSQKSHVIQTFHDYGAIAIQSVPGFEKAHENFIESARRFMALSNEQRAAYTPPDAYARGWSYGIEKFNGNVDAFKGSYYASYPEEQASAANIWPSQDIPDFEKTYLNLVRIIFETGKEILPLMNISIPDVWCASRMLYYGPIHGQHTGEWCGEHRDHGLLTGLCPGIYFLEGKETSQPPETGLFIRGKEVVVPKGTLMFQIGEVAELITNGTVTATEHHVRKALGGYERYSFALFMSPPFKYVMESTLTKYNDRFTPSITYEEWNQRSFATYNENVPVGA